MNDKIIRFPGVRSTSAMPPQPEGALAPPSRVDDEKPEPRLPNAITRLDPEREKAIALIAMGKPFILVAITPTDSGADFHTAMAGDATDLRNAQPHLLDVIARLYARKGL